MLYLGNFIVEGVWFQGHVTQSPVNVRAVAGVDLEMPSFFLAGISASSRYI